MRKPKLTDEDYPTTGHEWDGIREYDKPMPRWWLITFIICVVWAIGYTIAYPAWPLISGATPGLLGYSSRGAVAEDIQTVNNQNAQIEAKLLATPMESVGDDSELARFATAGGGAVFRTYCSQCHGAGAQGAKGYPNLQDDDWLWGGSITAIETSIRHGIRHDLDEDTRYSEMPKFGEFLEEEEITNLAAYVGELSGQEHDAGAAANGKTLFADNCSSCHGDTGLGDREQGAENARFGVMPAWQDRITDAQIKQVAFYVHQLGGGE
jgi:cytochrome c oxidase cbb3-type subunit 3